VGQKRFDNQDNGHQDHRESIEMKARFIENKQEYCKRLIADNYYLDIFGYLR
jgi:hypothetical protein